MLNGLVYYNELMNNNPWHKNHSIRVQLTARGRGSIGREKDLSCWVKRMVFWHTTRTRVAGRLMSVGMWLQPKDIWRTVTLLGFCAAWEHHCASTEESQLLG